MKFTKMHGLGNDFILLNEEIPSNYVKTLCDRYTGIGADGVVMLTPSTQADIHMRIINADGSPSAQCGNALRCVAKYLYEQKGLKRSQLYIETAVGIQSAILHLAGTEVAAVTVDMGPPKLRATEIPMASTLSEVIARPISIVEKSFNFTAVSMGNPHIIIEVVDLPSIPLSTWGPSLEHHPLFPERTNVEFIQVLTPDKVVARVWERGVGETAACGSGACAIVVAGVLLGKLARAAEVVLNGGSLFINWDPEDERVYMRGPATYVFEGKIE